MAATSLGPWLTPREILNEASAERHCYDAHSLELLIQTARYISEFLTQPHPALGRPGAVCPFAAGGLLRDTIALTASSLREPDRDALIGSVTSLLDLFGDSETAARSADEVYRAVVIVFPNLPDDSAAALIEHVQKELKPSFVASGLMIGEFFPGCASPGLHSADFRPMDTSFSSLAIRRMTISDLPFMMDDDRFISSYLRNFDLEGRKRLSSLLLQEKIAPGRQDTIRQLLGSVDRPVLAGQSW